MTKKKEVKQKIFKLSTEHCRRLAVASHMNYMSEAELIRLLIDQAYEKTIERQHKNPSNV